jgi:alkylhydroperoxidase family enzyme
MAKRLYVTVIGIAACFAFANFPLAAKDTAAAHTFSAADVQAREAEITGKPPRIAPLKSEEISKDAFDSINVSRKAINLPPLTELPDLLATTLRHPALYRASGVLSEQLYHGELAAHDRELAILRTAWLCQAPFEWGEHVKIGKRMGGLTDEEVARVTEGSAAPGWNERDRALLRAVEEMHGNAMISDATWAVLAKNLNDKQLIELPVLVAKYQGVAYVANSLRIRLMPGNKGLTER